MNTGHINTGTIETDTMDIRSMVTGTMEIETKLTRTESNFWAVRFSMRPVVQLREHRMNAGHIDIETIETETMEIRTIVIGTIATETKENKNNCFWPG